MRSPRPAISWTSRVNLSGPKGRQNLYSVFHEGWTLAVGLLGSQASSPEEIRGPYHAISTSVPGLQISDQLPSWGPIMKHLTVIRLVTHEIVDHNAGAYYGVTGRHPTLGEQLVTRPSRDNFPPIGSVLAKLLATDQPLPDFIHVPKRMFNSGSFIPRQLSGFLRYAYDPLIREIRVSKILKSLAWNPWRDGMLAVC